MKNQNQELIGKYVNQSFYTDIEPVGKIIGTRGKTILIVQKVVAGRNKTKMNFVSGGFAGHCTNQYDQEYDFEELEETIELRMNKQWGKRGQMFISDNPRKYYDYNF